MKKRSFLSLILFFLILAAAFAAPGGGGGSSEDLAEEARLYYFPRNGVNNSSVLVDLTEAQSMAGTAASQFTEDFSAYNASLEPQNLAIFRIRETLTTTAAVLDNKNVLSTANDPTNNYSIQIKIESESDWTFINEYNSTRTTRFELEAFCVEEKWRRTSSSSDYNYDSHTAVQLSAATILENSGRSATFSSTGSYYVLELPYTYYSQAQQRHYPRYIRDADICLKIPGDIGAGLEPGYYYTKLIVTIPAHTEVNASKGTESIGEKEYHITLRGYLGIDESSSGSSSFSVISASDSYSMDLGIESNPTGGYSVAEAKFVFTDVATGAVGKASDPRPANAETKYTIYVSPTSNYRDTTSVFKFIKMGSENQSRTHENTIYYSISWEYADASLSNTSYDHQTASSSNPYVYMRPKYTSTQVATVHGSGNSAVGRNIYQINWEMDNIIKLNLTQDSLDNSSVHQEGLYYSYIYFTLVTND